MLKRLLTAVSFAGVMAAASVQAQAPWPVIPGPPPPPPPPVYSGGIYAGNDTPFYIWITIYDITGSIHTDTGCIAPHQSYLWPHYPALGTAAEMKAGVGCSDPYNPRNLCETTVFVSPSSLGTWADAAVTLKYYYTGSKPPPVGITFGCYWEHYNFGRTLGIPNAKARSSVGANY